jgi:hypothetical protein
MPPAKCDVCGRPLPADYPSGFTLDRLRLCAACYHSDKPEIQDKIDQMLTRPPADFPDPGD